MVIIHCELFQMSLNCLPAITYLIFPFNISLWEESLFWGEFNHDSLRKQRDFTDIYELEFEARNKLDILNKLYNLQAWLQTW